MIKYIIGDIITLSKSGEFDIIIQGINCFNRQKSGLAKIMVENFNTDKFPMEQIACGDLNKLGKIDYRCFTLKEDKNFKITESGEIVNLIVVNCYTQYKYGSNYLDGDIKPLNYEALTECMRNVNKSFKGLKIGVPKIGSGLAGGDWNKIKEIIIEELKELDIIFVSLT